MSCGGLVNSVNLISNSSCFIIKVDGSCGNFFYMRFYKLALSFHRKSAFGSAERKIPVKKLVAEFSKVKCKTPKASPLKEEPSSSLTESISRRELRSQETPERARSLGDTPLKSFAPLKGAGCHTRERGSCSETEDLPYLSTTEMYLCRWHQPPPSPLREPSPKKEETVASKRLAHALVMGGLEGAWNSFVWGLCLRGFQISEDN